MFGRLNRHHRMQQAIRLDSMLTPAILGAAMSYTQLGALYYDPAIGLSVLLMGTAELFGFWFLGICLTALVTFIELLARSLRPQLSSGLFGSAGLFGTLGETASGTRDGVRSAAPRTSSPRPE